MFPQSNRTALHETQYTGFGGGVVGLLSSTNKGGDRRDTDDGAARRVLGGHLPSCGLDRVERAIEIRADGFGEEVRFYAAMRISATAFSTQVFG